MESLSIDMISEIIKFLQYPDILKLKQVSKTLLSTCLSLDKLISVKYIQYMDNKIDMDYQIDIPLYNTEGYTICESDKLVRYLIVSCFTGRLDNVKYIIQEKGVKLKGGLITEPAMAGMLINAAMRGRYHVLQYLLSYPEVHDPGIPWNRALMSAVGGNHLDIVDLLLKDGRVDPREHNQEALTVAIFEGNLGIVDRILQDARIDPTFPYNRPIKVAMEMGKVEVVRDY